MNIDPEITHVEWFHSSSNPYLPGSSIAKKEISMLKMSWGNHVNFLFPLESPMLIDWRVPEASIAKKDLRKVPRILITSLVKFEAATMWGNHRLPKTLSINRNIHCQS